MEMDHESIQETLKLTRDNNRMLHSMRRNAFLGGIFKVVLWAAFIIVPGYFYYLYLAPVMQQMLATMNAAQKGGAQAQVQIQNFQDMIKNLESKIPGLSPAKTP